MFFEFLILFLNFGIIFGNRLLKCSEIIGKFVDVIVPVRKRSQELKILRSPQKDPSKMLLRASNDGKIEWNTTPLYTANIQRQSWPLIGCIGWDKMQ